MISWIRKALCMALCTALVLQLGVAYALGEDATGDDAQQALLEEIEAEFESDQEELQAREQEALDADASEPGEDAPAGEEGVEDEPSSEQAADPAEPAKTPEAKADVKKRASKEPAAKQGLSPMSTNVGTVFVDENDEGIPVVYKVISSEAVQVGAGVSGKTNADNYPAEVNKYGQTTRREFTTVPVSFNGTVTIPETVRYEGVTFKVTSVANSAFGRYYEYMTPIDFALSKIVLPETVTSIGSNAFNHANLNKGVEYSGDCNLGSIGNSAFESCGIGSFDIPEKLVSLGSSAFYRASLSQVNMPEKCGIKAIPANCFRESKIFDFEVPEYITGIGNYAFAGSSLRQFTLPSWVTSLGIGAFSDSFVESFTISEKSPLGELPAYTLKGCKYLTGITIPACINSLESNCLAESGLTSFTVPVTLTYLGEYCFSKCKQLAAFTFEDGHQLMAISNGAFNECTKLREITLPGNIRTIGDYAFSGCVRFTEFHVPEKVESLGAFAFQGCTDLETIVFEGNASKLTSQSSTFYQSWNMKNVVFWGKRSRNVTFVNSKPQVFVTVNYYDDKAQLTSGAAPSGRFCIPLESVPNEVNSVQAFSGARRLPPAGCNWVAEDGFSFEDEATNSFYAYAEPVVETLEAGSTFTADTVEGATVTYTVVKEATETEPGQVMVGTYGATLALGTAISLAQTGSVTLPDKVVGPDANSYVPVSVGDYAFANCSRFVTIHIPGTVTSIGGRAFYHCATLRNVYFDSDATGIVDDGIFNGCGNIQLVVFGGKKANVSFGSSDPSVYYTVKYYENKSYLDKGVAESVVLVRERAKLEALRDNDLLKGVPPELRIGFEWAYEEGFSGTRPLTDSCYVYQNGIGIQYEISVLEGNVDKTPCWFKILSVDEEARTGTVQVGLSKRGVTAISQYVTGKPVLPGRITVDGIAYTVVGVGDYAFGADDYWEACVGLTGINLSSNLTSIGAAAFKNCQAISNVSLTNGITQLGDGCFEGCTALEGVAMPAGLTGIPARCFYGDVKLESLVLPAGVTSIGASAFEGCYHRVIDQEKHLDYTEGLRSVDITAAKHLASIGARAFYNCRLMDLKSAGGAGGMFPDALSSVGDYAFYYTSVMDVSFGTGLQHLGEQAFRLAVNLRTITFRGDARNVWFGSRCFDVREGLGPNQAPGAIGKVIFLDKKAPGIESCITSGDPRYYGDYGRSYHLYYTVRTYASRSDFKAGKVAQLVTMVEDAYPSKQKELVKTGYYAWSCEDGFSLDKHIEDSFYAVRGYNLANAKWTGVEDEYNYTGSFIKPLPVLTYNGTVLCEGVDYVYDTAYGQNHDGYANNKRTGTAKIYLRGIGNYAGQLVIPFTILPVYANAALFKSVTPDGGMLVYDGNPKTPTFTVVGEVKGKAYHAVEGLDFMVEYENNVNAGTATAILKGIGAFSGSHATTFQIMPMPISRCTLTGVEASYEETGEAVIPVVTLVNPSGTTLVEGVDYRMTVANNTTSGAATVIITGLGNYAGALVRSFTIGEGSGNGQGGTGSGEGGGQGSGESEGGGHGVQPGKGESKEDGHGTSKDGDADTDGQSDKAGEFGGETVPTIAGKAGSVTGGSKYHLYALDGAEIPVEKVKETVEYAGFVLALLVLMALGAIRMGAEYRYQRSGGRRDGEETPRE